VRKAHCPILEQKGQLLLAEKARKRPYPQRLSAHSAMMLRAELPVQRKSVWYGRSGIDRLLA
jgi:hypothetical protein